MELSDRIELAASRAGYNPTSLARLIGISQVAMRKIFEGETIDPGKIVEISIALGVNPKWLKLGDKYPMLDSSIGESLMSNDNPALNSEIVEKLFNTIEVSVKMQPNPKSITMGDRAKTFTSLYKAVVYDKNVGLLKPEIMIQIANSGIREENEQT